MSGAETAIQKKKNKKNKKNKKKLLQLNTGVTNTDISLSKSITILRRSKSVRSTPKIKNTQEIKKSVVVIADPQHKDYDEIDIQKIFDVIEEIFVPLSLRKENQREFSNLKKLRACENMNVDAWRSLVSRVGAGDSSIHNESVDATYIDVLVVVKDSKSAPATQSLAKKNKKKAVKIALEEKQERHSTPRPISIFLHK
jgi:hypothetical protein